MRWAIYPHHQVVEWLRAEKFTMELKLMSMTYVTPFMAYLKLAFIASIFFSSPFIAYQMWKFIGAGLYHKEKRFIFTYGPFSFLLFLGGCAFGYLFVLPYGLYYLAKYADPKIIMPQYTLSDYLSLVMWLTIVMGIVFQLPLIMAFFAKIGLVTAKSYISWWKFAVVAIFVVSAVLTPGPDVFSQLAMGIPLCLLYGLGIILSVIVAKKSTA